MQFIDPISRETNKIEQTMNSSRLRVQITTFVSPHLFWFFDLDKLLDRTDLEVELAGTLLEPIPDDPVLGEIVAVHENEIWQRAVVQSITEGSYQCWSLDYGVPLKVQHVYKLADNFKILPPFAKKACLNNLVYLIVDLYIETSEIQYIETYELTTAAAQIVLQHLKKAEEIFVIIQAVNEMTHFGDIVYFKDKKKYSLTQILVDDKIMSFNANLFKEALALCQLEYENNIKTRNPFMSTLQSEVHLTTPKLQLDFVHFSNMMTIEQNVMGPSEGFGKGKRQTRVKTPSKICGSKKLLKLLSPEKPILVTQTDKLNLM